MDKESVPLEIVCDSLNTLYEEISHLRNQLADAREEIENFKLCERIPCVHEERLLKLWTAARECHEYAKQDGACGCWEAILCPLAIALNETRPRL